MEVIFLDCETEMRQKDAYAMAMGFFDGVHLGHQELLKSTSRYAKQHHIKSAAFTFSPHPDEVIKGMENRKYITLLQEKIEKIAACGIDTIFVMKFDFPFASLDPYEFIDRYVLQMNVKHVVVGFDFTFGFKAKGNVAMLRRVAQSTECYSVSVIPKKTVHAIKIGSTETKALVQQGKVEEVIQFLGNDYTIQAKLMQIDYDMFRAEINEKYILPNKGTYLIKICANGYTTNGQLMVEQNKAIIQVNDLYDHMDLSYCHITFLKQIRVSELIFA
ncbi:FAD synthetase family protein [Pseudogracilibacillus sp. SO10305]|uniref:FAD synthetase family protein n=1 Tax=Pseudogracilibacillus sp. SO10305 TaxID=3098292 RepID=UPI00300E2C05